MIILKDVGALRECFPHKKEYREVIPLRAWIEYRCAREKISSELDLS